MTIHTAHGTKAAALPAYPPHRVPPGLATAAQLRADHLALVDVGEEVRGWQVEPTAGGAVRHTPLYERADTVPPLPEEEGERLYLSSAVLDASGWALDMYGDRRWARIVGLRTSPCCGRIVEAAALDLGGRTRFHDLAAAPPGAACTACATDGGLSPGAFYEGLRRGMRRSGGTLIGWGLADALLLEQTIAPHRHSPQQKRLRQRWSIELEDAQQWEAEGRAGDAWSPTTGWQYTAFPPETSALERCRHILSMIRKLMVWDASEEHAIGDPLLSKAAGEHVEYGVLVLPRELALLDEPPPPAEVPRPRAGGPRSRLVPVERRLVEESTWRSPAAEGRLQRSESALVEDFTRHLTGLGHTVSRHEIDPGAGAVLYTDVFDENTGVLYEAKASTERRDLRMAIGQLLDYRHHLTDEHPHLRLAVLLPAAPSPDLHALLESLGIAVVHRDGASFHAGRDGDLLAARSTAP